MQRVRNDMASNQAHLDHCSNGKVCCTDMADAAMVQVERQRAALAAIDLEAEEESGINRELAAVMCTRLDAARRATEKLLGVLQVGIPALLVFSHSLSPNHQFIHQTA